MDRQLTLNVILHGAYLFDRESDPGRIRALIPRMKHHVYRAGNWLAETELRGRTGDDEAVYELTGVNPGGVTLDPKEGLDVFVEPRDEGEPKHHPFAVIRLELPRRITSLRVASIKRSDF